MENMPESEICFKNTENEKENEMTGSGLGRAYFDPARERDAEAERRTCSDSFISLPASSSCHRLAITLRAAARPLHHPRGLHHGALLLLPAAKFSADRLQSSRFRG